MTIYTSMELTHKHEACADGTARSLAALNKLGYDRTTLVPMRVVLDELGLADCVFSFCEVTKASRREADTVLQEYSLYLLQLLVNTWPQYVNNEVLRVAKKRVVYGSNPQQLENVRAIAIRDSKDAVTLVEASVYSTYVTVLADRPIHQCMTQATKGILQAAYLSNDKGRIHSLLTAFLQGQMPQVAAQPNVNTGD